MRGLRRYTVGVLGGLAVLTHSNVALASGFNWQSLANLAFDVITRITKEAMNGGNLNVQGIVGGIFNSGLIGRICQGLGGGSHCDMVEKVFQRASQIFGGEQDYAKGAIDLAAQVFGQMDNNGENSKVVFDTVGDIMNIMRNSNGNGNGNGNGGLPITDLNALATAAIGNQSRQNNIQKQALGNQATRLVDRGLVGILEREKENQEKEESPIKQFQKVYTNSDPEIALGVVKKAENELEALGGIGDLLALQVNVNREGYQQLLMASYSHMVQDVEVARVQNVINAYLLQNQASMLNELERIRKKDTGGVSNSNINPLGGAFYIPPQSRN